MINDNNFVIGNKNLIRLGEYMVKVDQIGPWSRKKLELLDKYLVAYTSIMNTEKIRKWCTGCYYIDAFAGSVTPWDREAQQYIDGSPRVALKVYPSFDAYDFIDIEEGRVKEKLQPLMNEFPDKQIRLHHGDSNKVILEKIIPQYLSNNGRCSMRGFVFLDPYGLELEWETVEAIGNAKVFDAFINFSVMGVTRQCSTSPPREDDRERIDKLMGANDWDKEVYKDNPVFVLPGLDSSIFGVVRQEGVTERLIKYYCKRLQTCFKHVSRPIIMRNSMNGPLYALILASQHELAKNKMHEIFDRAERLSK